MQWNGVYVAAVGFAVLVLVGWVWTLFWKDSDAEVRPAPPLDPMLGSVEARAVLLDLQRGEVRSLAALLGACREGAWDARSFYLGLLAEHCPRPALDAWVAASPRDPLAWLARGAQGIRWAWEARGTGFADTVPKEGWRLLRERLLAAEQDLQLAAALDPSDPTPFAQLLTVERGLERPHDDARRCFEQAVARDPEHWDAHLSYMSFLMKKWFGSHEAMFEFARKVAAAAPPGSDLPALLIKAHLERWQAHRDMEDRADLARRYLTDRAVRAEVVAAHERSLASPQRRERRTSVYARNTAALWFYLVEDAPRLRVELQRLGPATVGSMWSPSKEQASSVIAHARQLAG